MKKQNSKSEVAAILRHRAEEVLQLKEKASLISTPAAEVDRLKLIHELQVHQIELEMQIEELVIAKEKAEQAEEKAKLAEEKYAELYDFAPSGFILLSKEGDILDLNFAAARMLGKERSKLLKNRFALFISQETLAVFNLFVQRVFAKKKKQSCEAIIATKGNLPIYVNIDGIVSQNNEICLLTVVDITELKQAEEKLKTSDKIFDHSLDMLCIAGFDGYFKVLNPAWTNILGWSNVELLSKPWIDFVHPDDRNNTEDVKTVIVDGKEIYQFENRYMCKDGTIKWLSWNSFPYPEENIMFGVARDVTVRKQADQELKKAKEKAEESEKLFKSLIKNAPNGIVIIDEQGKYKFVSPNAERLFGYNKDEAIGHSGSENTHPDDLPMVLKALDTIYADPGKKPKLEYRFKRKNGEFRWIETTFTNLLSDRAIKGIVLNFSDISERKQIFEELLITKEKAEESDRLKSAFLANMSHEIRTPMNGILGFSELLKKPNLTGEEQQKYISIIEKSGKRMLNIINNIIDISKIEAGLMKLDMNESNINEMIEYVYTFFKPEAVAKKIKLAYKTPLPLKKATIKTDHEKVYAILTNLLKNAIKYTEKGEIELGYNIVETKGRAFFLRFYIKDAGIGIKKDRQDAIFERFIQADIQDKMARQGAGLGLAISQAYVDMLGGKIWVESEEGKGSTFYFTLPYQAEPAPETICQQGDPLEQCNAIRKLKILMVEDDEVSEMLLDETVNIFSKEILKARTGIEAVKACRNNPDIDLILMDIQMPEMGGFEATKQIREFNKEVVIIAQTAYGLTGDREKSIESGCNDYIAKPIQKTELLALIHKYFGK